MMLREKQIEEMANILWHIPNNYYYYLNSYNDYKRIAERIYDDGEYRKQSEVAKEIFDVIKEKAVAFSIASVDEKVIDEINILNAAHLAFKKAIDALNPAPEIALIDGNSMKNLSCPFELIVKGDQKSLTIAAASVLAKVSRAAFMLAGFAL